MLGGIGLQERGPQHLEMMDLFIEAEAPWGPGGRALLGIVSAQSGAGKLTWH